MSPQTRTIDDIDRLRGIAALMVYLHHIPHQLIDAFISLSNTFCGGSFVDLFFVISGFVITRSLYLRVNLPPVIGLIKFYFRRICRIFPLAIFVLLLMCFSALLFPSHQVFGPIEKVCDEVKNILLFRYNYTLVRGTQHLGVYWSLMVEEHFYFVLPLLFVVFRKSQILAISSIAILALFVLRPFAVRHGVTSLELMHFSHWRFDALFAGVLLGCLHNPIKEWKLPRGVRGLLTLINFVLIIGLAFAFRFFEGRGQLGHVYTVTTLISVALVYIATLNVGAVFGSGVIGRALLWFGKRSYAIYLIHVWVMRIHAEMILQLSNRGSFLTTLLFVKSYGVLVSNVVATLTLAAFLHRFVEKPFIVLGRRLEVRIKNQKSLKRNWKVLESGV